MRNRIGADPRIDVRLRHEVLAVEDGNGLEVVLQAPGGMPPQPKDVLRIETVWLREYARTYLPCEAGFSFPAARLRAAQLSLLGVTMIFHNGIVVFADKRDEPGAIWVVEGSDENSVPFRLTVAVVTATLAVDLVRVERLLEENGNEDDAA